MDEIVKYIKELLDSKIHLMDVQENHQFESIRVVVDSEEPISIATITDITKRIQRSETIEKLYSNGYRLEVTSVGVTANLELPFQFRKNISRKLKIKVISGEKVEVVKAILKDIDDDGIFIQNGEKIDHINYANIKQANVIVSFS